LSHQPFARKYRPQSFKDIAGQSHIATALVNSIKSGRIASVYLFSGPRGTGKTSSARILAKALNCATGPTPDFCNSCDQCLEITSGNSLDVIEIDGASNNSVDEVRALRENVKYAPAKSRYKVYIIDEVHMLSVGAFNALLKTLEEPPNHVVFILATTEVHKLPETVLSRCQRYDFRRAPLKDIVALLKKVAVSESLSVEDGATMEIAMSADGSFRDAESILDKLVSYCGARVGEADVVSILGLVDKKLIFDLAQAAIDRDPARALAVVERAMNYGYDPAQFVKQLMGHYRNLMLTSAGSEDLLEVAASELGILKKQSSSYPVDDTLRAIRLISEMEIDIWRSSQPRTMLEVLAARLARMDSSILLSEVLKKLSDLERHLAGAGPRALELPFEAEGGPTQTKMEPEGDSKKNAAETLSVPPQGLSPSSHPAPSDVWTAVIEEIRKERVDLKTRLMIMGGQLRVEDGKTIVEFKNGLYRDELEKAENRRLIEDKIKKMMGKDREVLFSFSESRPDEPTASSPSSGRSQLSHREDIQTTLRKYPILEKALTEFAGQIVSLAGGEESLR